MKKTKVNIIGIDGGELSIISKMVERGFMPNMKEIIKQSYVSKMDCYAEGPGQGWASFMTGKKPSKHGIFYWKVYSGVSSGDIEDEKLWDVLGKSGISCGVANLSYTFPPKPINGFMISGLGGGQLPSDDIVYSYPSDLIDELNKNASGYVWGLKRVPGGVSIQEAYLQRLIEMTDKRGKAFLYLMEQKKPDCFVAIFRGADAIQHSFWHLLESEYEIVEEYKNLNLLINKYYNTLDHYIGEMWNQNKDGYNFIISDHGFGPTQAVININEYLSMEGYLFKKKNLKSLTYNAFLRKTKPFMLRFYLNYLAKYNTMRSMDKIRKKSFPKIEMNIDLDMTTVYARCPYGLCFNRKLVDTESKRDLTFRDIRKRLLELRDSKSGGRLFQDLYYKEELKIKTHMAAAPDLIFQMADESFRVSPDIDTGKECNIFHLPDDVYLGMLRGSHRRNGIFISTERPTRCDGFDDINITDVYATVLNLFHIPIPHDVDGRILFPPKIY